MSDDSDFKKPKNKRCKSLNAHFLPRDMIKLKRKEDHVQRLFDNAISNQT